MLNFDRLTPNWTAKQSEKLKEDAKELRRQVEFLQGYAQRLEEMIRTSKEPL
jgi:hypothetical protein